MYFIKNLKKGAVSAGQYVSAALSAPSDRQAQVALFILGISLLSLGIGAESLAQFDAPGQFNDDRIAIGINRIYTYLEGAFGALIMIAAGLGAIISAAFGQYRAALALLVVAVGAFILRSLVATFFNTESIENASFLG